MTTWVWNQQWDNFGYYWQILIAEIEWQIKSQILGFWLICKITIFIQSSFSFCCQELIVMKSHFKHYFDIFSYTIYNQISLV